MGERGKDVAVLVGQNSTSASCSEAVSTPGSAGVRSAQRSRLRCPRSSLVLAGAKSAVIGRDARQPARMSSIGPPATIADRLTDAQPSAETQRSRRPSETRGLLVVRRTATRTVWWWASACTGTAVRVGNTTTGQRRRVGAAQALDCFDSRAIRGDFSALDLNIMSRPSVGAPTSPTPHANPRRPIRFRRLRRALCIWALVRLVRTDTVRGLGRANSRHLPYRPVFVAVIRTKSASGLVSRQSRQTRSSNSCSSGILLVNRVVGSNRSSVPMR